MSTEFTEDQQKHTDLQHQEVEYSSSNNNTENTDRPIGRPMPYQGDYTMEDRPANNYRQRNFRNNNNNNRYDNRYDRGGYMRRNDGRGGYYSQQDDHRRDYAHRGYDDRCPQQGDNFSYRERFLASQKGEAATPVMEGDQPLQRRRRMRIAEVKAMGAPEERQGYNSYPHQGQDTRYNRPYHNQRGMNGDRYPHHDGYQRDYMGGRYSDDRYVRMDDYPHRGGYHNYDMGQDSAQREYYKERYNQARENNRQQYEYRNPYNNGDDNRYQSYGRRPANNRRPQQRNGYNNPEGYAPQQQMGRPSGYHNPKPAQKPQKKAQKKFTPRPEPIVYENDHYDENEPIRLNKYLANSGVCSRREADELIQKGEVLVNGVAVTELGTKITLKDSIVVNGKEVKPENKVYILLNKPRNCVTTSDDPQERLTVLHLVRKACKERIYPVGRLDRNTTGVLLLTNDGDLASKLVHPSFKKKKIYHVWLDKEVTVEDMQKIADGVELEDGEMHADAISYASEEDHTQVGIEIHSGRNRIVRRLFEHLGYHVYKLDRVYFAGLTKKNLGRGKWRYLTQEEVNFLRMGAFE